MIYVKDGELLFSLNNEKRILRSGDIALVKPGKLHGYVARSGQASSGLDIKFLLENRDLISAIKKVPEYFRNTSRIDDVLNMTQAFVDNTPPKIMMSDLNTGALAAYVSLLLYSIGQEHFEKVEAEIQKNTVYIIEKYVNDHFHEKIYIDDIAKLAGYNKSYTCALYKKERKITINEYINKVRISTACDLLLGSGMSVSDVAKNCGFNSLSHFSYTFKEVVGVSPRQYIASFDIKAFYSDDDKEDTWNI